MAQPPTQLSFYIKIFHVSSNFNDLIHFKVEIILIFNKIILLYLNKSKKLLFTNRNSIYNLFN